MLVFIHAIASAVFGPALTASIPSLVARHEFTAANALLQTTTSIGIIIGPALSGVGIATMSSQEVLCINAVSYVVSAICFLFIRFPWSESQLTAANSLSNTLRDVMDGFRFVLVKQRMILMLIGAASMYTFATSAFSTLFPVFGKKLLDLGPIEVGYLWSAFGVGLLAGFIGAHFSIRVDAPATHSGDGRLEPCEWVGDGWVGMDNQSHDGCPADDHHRDGRGHIDADSLGRYSGNFTGNPVGTGVSYLQSRRDDICDCGHDAVWLDDAGIRRANKCHRDRSRPLPYRDGCRASGSMDAIQLDRPASAGRQRAACAGSPINDALIHR